MNTPLRRRHPPAAALPLLLGAALLLALAGCYTAESGYVARPRPVSVVAVDTYVYYPGYEVYYNNARRQYVYRDGNVWVTRRDPPRAWARDLRQAPSVHVDFHDAPEHHHAEVIRTYPRNWKQPPPHRDEHKGDKDRRDHDDRR